ncbi:MAG: SMP-30/gluconolactonase/LRE family protein [Deltaproteobacteria bacterium]|uniref:SMP-30/gluconolactonase/LRE family protein n=1 Tax=Candidatus Zymogenus saltonus TaxID=2844893 RepID=A0A9D8KC05_9DELT|nr:SMP-30/gluconolactonase/LRE family protein [Candidatus Zymogenus saltonus]
MSRKTVAFTILAIIGILAAYLLLWPVPIDPAPYSPLKAPELTGVYEPNDYLSKIERLGEGAGVGPEDVAIDDGGNIYGGMEDGSIVKLSPDGQSRETYAQTGGRPLGLKFDGSKNLIVACGQKGLLSIDPKGKVTTLATEEGGIPFKNTEDLDIAKDGVIYFTDGSSKFNELEFYDELMEHRPNGRFLKYDPKTKETTLFIDGIHFANGVAISPDQSFVLICEMGMYRVLRYWLSGEKRGEHEVFIDNLPGFPDGISSNGKDTFWLTLVSPRDATADKILFPRPRLRKIVSRLPQALLPSAKNYDFILGLDVNGNVVHNLQDPAGSFFQITNVVEHDGYLYLGSLVENAMGKVAVP